MRVAVVPAVDHQRVDVSRRVEAPALRAELEDFRATVTDSGRWTFGARSGAHDDLVLALALALWRANRRNPTNIHPSVIQRSMQMRRLGRLEDMVPDPNAYDASAELRMFQQRALARSR